ncbi:MAG: hypothetical protein WCE73_23675, partial [Candidatus Angelobacter sp.]
TTNHQCCARGAPCHGEPFAGTSRLTPSQKRKNFMISNTKDTKEHKGELGIAVIADIARHRRNRKSKSVLPTRTQRSETKNCH